MSRKFIVITGLVLLLMVGLAPWIRSQQPAVLVVDGATLIDGTGAAPVANSVIVIENGKITAVGPRSRVRIPAGARTVDAKGKYVIPGLIDGHVHYRHSWLGELFLNNGITTVFDFGNPYAWVTELRDTERTGKEKYMPRMFIVGEAINRPGGNITPSFGSDAGEPSRPGPANTPQGPEWARNATKMRIAQGVDAIKVTSDNLTAEEMRAITDEAHKANLKVIGHVADVYKYVENGFDGVVHLWGVSATLMTDENRKRWEQDGTIMNPYSYMEPSKMDALVKVMVEHKTGLMPLLINEHSGAMPRAPEFEAAVEKLFADPGLRYVPQVAVMAYEAMFRRDRSYSKTVGGFPYMQLLTPAQADEARRGYKNALDFTGRFNKAGGRVWLGTDTPGAGTVSGLGLRQEVQLVVEAGLTPMQAIQAATKNTAEMFNKADQVGTLQVGRWGDVVILDANPLSDIRNIDKIRTVIKAGEVLDGRYHGDYHPPFWKVGEEDFNSSRPHGVPVLTSVTVEPGASKASATIVAKGRELYDITQVYLNGVPLDTTFVNTGELRAVVAADRRPAKGPYTVTIRTVGSPGTELEFAL